MSKEPQLTFEFKNFIRRRTRLFLDRVGVELPLSFLLEESYLQGMRDAVQTMTAMNDYGPRWIADLDAMEITERQSDGTYRTAFKMAPLTA